MIYLDHNATTPVLPEAMKSGPVAHESIRFSLGITNTLKEVFDTISAVQRSAVGLGGVR